MELDWEMEYLSTGIKYAAASSDEDVCGGEFSCAAEYCGTGGTFLVFVSGSERKGTADFTTFFYQVGRAAGGTSTEHLLEDPWHERHVGTRRT